MPLECPCCGSTNTTLREETQTYTPPYGESVEFKQGVIDCSTCGESVVSPGYSDSIQDTIRRANIASAKGILADLMAAGLTAHTLEYKLGLPVNTVSSWLREDITPSAVVLLQIVKTYPWILEVTASRFDQATTEEGINYAFKAIRGLAERQQDLPEDFAQLLNEHFWELL